MRPLLKSISRSVVTTLSFPEVEDVLSQLLTDGECIADGYWKLFTDISRLRIPVENDECTQFNTGQQVVGSASCMARNADAFAGAARQVLDADERNIGLPMPEPRVLRRFSSDGSSGFGSRTYPLLRGKQVGDIFYHTFVLNIKLYLK